ncbi:hypothetical protein EJ02DRAFT_344649 [Clathrospora elynae]|uniref:SET domain-containing protein n=1 Tax=Clathrospora elynae TaxID=706981 RepID=A0A6A5SRZ5_9PLEO|nr:hypothetical protein EJ02DRAFT_344649 [Clathrospora elynae]
MPQSGLFATQDIPLGTRIICEPPLITLPAPGDQIDGLLLAFAALSEVDKERFWALPTCPASASEQLMAIKRQIDPLFPRMATLANKKTPQTPREVADVAKYGPRLEHAITTLRVAARWYAGRYSLTNLLEEERILLPKDTPIAGIFIEAGRLRHSCVPNCYAHYNSTANRMTVHATTNIAANEELNISHLASGYYEPAAERAQELSQKFGIRCNCTACSPSSNEYKKQEDARIRARDHALRLEHFLATLDDAEECDNSGAVVSLKPPTVSKPRTLAALEAAEQTALDVLQALRDMHCGSGIEFTRWFNALIDVINPALAEFPEYERATRSSLVLIHAAYVLRLCRWTVGEDSDEFAVLVARKKRVEGVIEGDEERAKGLEESRKRIGIL